MRIRQITFSPTGGTLRVCEALCEGLGTIATATELCVPADEVAVPTVGPSDLVVVGMPVYAGRVPALAVERLRCVETHGARCVVVAVYGNRAYEDALVEMRDVATAMGFRVVAAVAAIAEHSICRMYGAGRPDEADAHELAAFGAAIRNAMERKEPSHPRVHRTVPHGQRPLHGVRNVRQPMSCGSHSARSSPRGQPGPLHRMHALRGGLSCAGAWHR